MRSILRRVGPSVLPTVAILLLTACGLKDDLYLPADNPATEQPAAEQPAAEQAEVEDNEHEENT